MTKKKVFALLVLAVAATLLAACAGAAGPPGPEGPAGPAGPAGEAASMAELTCTECHNDTSLLTGKEEAWSESVHGSGEATAYAGGRVGCAGCHSGNGFSERIAAGITNPDEFEGGGPNPSRPDCRACHNIHTSYTSADWSLETTDPVPLYAFEDATFDGGEGNLCAACHQPRRVMEAEGGIVNVSSTHWGPHHGPQSAMLMGIGGAGDVSGSPSAHASMVEDTCVTCHLGADANHTFEPVLAACQECHADVEDFDVNGVQTEVDALLAELSAALYAKGMVALDDPAESDYLVAQGALHTGHPHPVPGEYPEAEAAALWNFIYVNSEDKSMGVHNSSYTIALLEASIEALK